MSVSLRYAAAAPPPERRPEKISEIEPGIYYIDIARVSGADYQEALPRLEKARGLIFDFPGLSVQPSS